MRTTLDHSALGDILPGTWVIAATNFPMWITGERSQARFTYELIGREPLVLSDEVSYLNADGEAKKIVGRDTWRDDGFVWRGTGWLKPFASSWSVGGVSDDGSIAVIRFSKSLATPAGIDIVVREGSHRPDVRAIVAQSTDHFGLSPEDLGSLTWLATAEAGW
jgi:hypothetical protein